MPDNVTQAYEQKIGPMTTPGGPAGAENAQTIEDVVRVLGPLADGQYQLDALGGEARILQGKQSVLAALSKAQLRQLGWLVRSGEGLTCNTDPNQDAIAYVSNVDAGGGTLEVHDAGRGKTA